MLEPFLCGPISGAPLLPKLRGHFAEFLDNASPAGLRILSSSTCVGLRYGCRAGHSGFSRHAPRGLPYSLSVPVAPWRAALSCPRLARCAWAGLSFPGSRLPACVPAFLLHGSTGISACRPSATRPRLALGPDFPGADQLYPGTLGYSAWGIPTPISLLIPAFSLPGAPPPLPARLRCPGNAPLPARPRALPGFGGVFQPRTFSARDLSASELLRTL